jgi:CubicO group peptidase (beta-lactamase class C family)
MRRDTIFRIASMTKPVTAAAALILVEDGRVALDAPVDRFLPELADRKVLRSITAPLDDVVPARRPITLRDLLTLRMGFGAVMHPPGTGPIQAAMDEMGLTPSGKLFSADPDEYLRRLSSLPLIHHPGEKWAYHTGLDVAGVLIARAAGTSLGAFLEERLFAPLRMKDTGFFVSEAKMGRLAACYRRDETEGLIPWEPRDTPWTEPPAFEAGGGGLVSTADDYLTFARMLLGKGSIGEVQVLRPESVVEMTRDQITYLQKASSPFFPGFWAKNGWGFGLSVTDEPDEFSDTPGRISWIGGYSTFFFADPNRDMVAVLLLQRLMDRPGDMALGEEFLRFAYSALDEEPEITTA